MINNLVSIIIPTYNRAFRVKDTIHSCIRQNYERIEIVVIDDGSTDSTKETLDNLIKANNTSKIIKYFYQKHSGACVARNRGLELAQGEYIQFLDSDDVIENNKINSQVKLLKDTNTPCAICDFKYIQENGKIIKTIKNDGDIHKYTSKLRSVSIMTPLIRRDSIIPNLRWNESLKRNQDMDFMFRYFITITKWAYVPGDYCNYIIHNSKRISDSYVQGMQFYMFYKSFKYFYKRNKNLIPVTNKWIFHKYKKEIFYRWIKFLIKRNLPKMILSFIIKYFFKHSKKDSFKIEKMY